MDESEYWFNRSRKMLDLPNQAHWTVFDKKAIDAGSTAEEGVTKGEVLKANSITDLANLMQVDAATLQTTITRYNQLAAAGNDEDFGKAAGKLTAIDTPPGRLPAERSSTSSILSAVPLSVCMQAWAGLPESMRRRI